MSPEFEEHGEASSPDTQAPEPKRRRKVTRSRAGCLVCRRRRKLCDMTKPNCSACERLSLECVWPPLKHLTSSNSESISPGATITVLPSPTKTVPRQQISTSSSRLDTRYPLNDHLTLPIDQAAELAAVNGIMGLGWSDGGGMTTNGIGTSYSGVPMFSSNSTNTSPHWLQPSITTLQTRPSQDLTGFNNQDSLFDTSSAFSFDEATLQLWAADCLPSLNGGQAQNPFDALSGLLFPSNPPNAPSIDPPVTGNKSTELPAPSESHKAMLQHYQESLSSLVSCSGVDAPNSFDAFTTLANAAMSSPAGQGLHLSILAWAGRHMVNQDQPRYEAVSERLGAQAAEIVLGKLGNKSEIANLEETELMTLFAGLLMLVQFKICRGDVWGYDIYVDHLAHMTKLLYPPDNHTVNPTNTQFHFFENLVYHYTVSSALLTRGPIMSDELLATYARPGIEGLHTLTGVSLQSFCIMQKIAGLIRQKHEHRDGVWTDENLADYTTTATQLEQDLGKEKRRLDTLIRAKPKLASHRYFHEAFRIACLLQLNSFVLGHPPSSLNVRFLVRRSLSLLETMEAENLPGFCSAHWVIFTTAVCAGPNGQLSGESDDRSRADSLYSRTITNLAFLNTSRSRRIVHEVWAKNKGGEIAVDWLDVLNDFGWEIIFA